MRRSLPAVLAAVLAAPPQAGAVVLKLRAGGEENVPSVKVEAGSVVLPDGKTLPREAVEEIRYAEGAPAQTALTSAPAASIEGAALLRRAAAFAKKNPGVDGIILAEGDDVTLRKDGTEVERQTFTGQILKEGLKGSWGRVASSFEDGRSRVRILKATVYEPDGRVFPLDPSKVQVTRPQAESLFFQDYRETTCQLPQLQVGSVIDWEVEVETYNPFRKDFFFPEWGFQDFAPVQDSTFRITVPEGTKLYTSATHFTGPWKGKDKADVSTKDGRTTYAWKLGDLPPIVREPDMVPYGDISPTVKASLFGSWDRIYDWLSKMYETRSTPGPELTRFTKELVKDQPTTEAKVAAIYHYVQKRVRYIAVKLGVASGWGGYDANLTWKRRYGCCIDKSLLLSAMLRAIGVKASPVLLDTNYSAAHDFKVPDIGFEHAITHITLDGKGMFLDSVGEDFRFPQLPTMDYGVKTLVVFDRKEETVPMPKPAENLSDYRYDLALSTDGAATARFSASYNGTHEGELRGYYKSLKDSELKKNFEDQVEGVSPSARLTSYRAENAQDLSKPFDLGWSCVLPDYLVSAGDLYLLKLPGLEQEFPETSLAKRRYGIEHHESFEKRWRYDVTLPPGVGVASLPKAETLEGPGETFKMGCRAGGKGLTCEADITRARRVVDVGEYSAHKAFLDKVARLTKERVFLKKGGA
ncbi:MAG: DUF3857 and transglutaminase domain-containing protein [Elusimicrobia bacterium]|nr:DUF3857 and transglutaminase domain-containing protein [Elusimicrobiota bacterium]